VAVTAVVAQTLKQIATRVLATPGLQEILVKTECVPFLATIVTTMWSVATIYVLINSWLAKRATNFNICKKIKISHAI
jgi:hypothetical protein